MKQVVMNLKQYSTINESVFILAQAWSLFNDFTIVLYVVKSITTFMI